MSERSVLPTTARALLARLATEQAGSRAPAITAGVVRRSALLWADGRGFRVLAGESRIRPDADTQSRIGSISKTFVAVQVARLRDEGLLDFADPLEKHLPGTPFGDRTIAQLLAHTSGIQSETDGPWWERTPGAPWDEFAQAMTPAMVKHPASRRFHYSNVGYGALGELVARIRQKPWFEVIDTEILAPLEMRRTTYSPQAPHLLGFAVHPYADVLLPEPTEDAGAMAPAGQIWSTVADLARWAAFVGGDTGEVLHPSTIEEMREPQIVENGPAWASGYGLGFQIFKVKERTLVGHTGSMPGFLAGLYVDVAESTGSVLLANSTSGVAITGLGAGLIEILAEREPELPSDWVPDAGQLANLSVVGPWYWGPSALAVRAKADGWLDLGPIANGAGRASRFKPSGRTDEWIGLDGYYAGETLRVVRTADGTPEHIDLASFILTRTPYDPSAPVPGGVDPRGWQTP